MTDECPPLLAVVFPAVVSGPPELSFTRAKVFLSTTRAWIALDGPAVPYVAQELTDFSLAVLGNNTYELTQADGSTVTIRQGGGCGCGSRLKTWHPFNGPLRVGT